MTPLRIGLIGVSEGLLHLRACREIDGLRVTAICDRGTEQLADVAHRFEIPTAVTDDERLLQAEDLDAVILCSADRRHRQQITAALDRGLHVYCSGPLTLNRVDCQSLQTAAAAHPDCRLMVGHLARFHPFLQAVHRVCREGRLGTIYALQIGLFSPGHEYLDPQSPKADPNTGTHPLLHVGHTAFDLARWLCGELTEVAATLQHKVLLRLPFEDTAQVQMTAASGARIGLLFAIGARRPPAITLQVLGTEGSLAGSTAGPRNQYWTVNGPDISRHDLPNEPTAGVIPASLQAFAAAIRDSREPSPSLVDGVQAVLAVQAALQSATADGAPVAVTK